MFLCFSCNTYHLDLHLLTHSFPTRRSSDLVQHQHQIMLVAGGAEALDELGAGRADAALALDRLEQETGGVVVDRGQRRVEIVERSEEHTSELQSLMRLSYAGF